MGVGGRRHDRSGTPWAPPLCRPVGRRPSPARTPPNLSDGCEPFRVAGTVAARYMFSAEDLAGAPLISA